MTPDIIEAHRFCTANYDQLKASLRCGCFYCGRIYDPQEITEWIEDRDGFAIKNLALIQGATISHDKWWGLSWLMGLGRKRPAEASAGLNSAISV